MQTFKDYLAVDYTQTGGDQVSYNAKKRHRFTDDNATEETNKKFRILATLVDPNNPSVTKRKEKLQRHANVTAPDLQSAIAKAKAYYKKAGYRVVDTVNATQSEETDIKERVITPAQRMKMRANFRKIRSKIKLGIARSRKKFATPEKLQARAEKKARDILTLRLTKKHKKDLALGQKQSVEKQLEKRKGAIKKIAKKLLPILRKKDRAKFKQVTGNSSGATGAAGA